MSHLLEIQDLKVRPFLTQTIHDFVQVPCRSRQAVELGHHQCVALPMPDRVTVIAWHQVLGVGSPIHIDFLVGVRPPDLENIDAFDFRDRDDLHSIGGRVLSWSG